MSHDKNLHSVWGFFNTICAVHRMEIFMTQYILNIINLIMPGIINFLIFFALLIIVNILFIPIFKKIAKRTNANWFLALIKGTRKPINILLIISGLMFFFSSISYTANFTSLYLMAVYRASIVFTLAWGLIRSKEIVRILLSKDESSARNETIIIFLTRIYIAIIAIFAFLMILSELHFDVTGILTGLGLGSLTIALAAQDAASNFFGGVIIIIERPFEVGDWIQADIIEGEVEDITFRSTKIRTLEGSLTIVPNSKLTASALTNWTKLQHRLSRFKIGLTYNTSTLTLQQVSKDLKQMLINFEGVEDDSIEICLDSFNESSIDVLITMYISAVKIKEYRSVMSEINYKIIEIMQKNNASFAYPTQSIYFENTLPN